MKLSLVVQSGSLAGRQITLDEGSLLLGRGEDCGLRFDFQADAGVSTHHAIIQSDPNGFYIADQKSTNGTFVNGQKIDSTWLQSGDVIQLSNQGPRMQVHIARPGEAEAPPPPQPASEMKTQFIPGAAAPSAGPARQPQYQQQQPQQHQQPAPGPGLRQTLTNIGTYNPAKEGKKTAPNWIGIVGGVAIAGLMSLIVMIIMLTTVGFPGTIVGTIMAFIPAPFYLFLYLWMDRYDPEPPLILAGAFAWGGLFAVIVSFVVNTVFGSVAAMVVGGPAGNTISSVISAPFIEESTKGLGVLLIMIFFRKEFDGILDGIVYAGVVALGFATVENVLYYGRTFAAQGFGGLLFIGFLRGVLSPFCHSLFTSMTGIGCGFARESHNKSAKWLAPIAGLIGAMALHAMWNGIASFAGSYFYIAYFIVWVPLFLIFLGVVIFMARREKNIIRRTLAFEAGAGLISQQQLELAASLFKRLSWIFSSGSMERMKARRKFLRSLTKLAFCYWHVERANAAGGHTISLPQIPKFRSEVKSLQGQI